MKEIQKNVKKTNISIADSKDSSGIHTIVVCQKLKGLKWNTKNRDFEKEYNEANLIYLPIEQVILKNDKQLDLRTHNEASRLKEGKECVILTNKNFGVKGTIESSDEMNASLKNVKVNAEVEGKKVRDVVFAKEIYQRMSRNIGEAYYSVDWISKKYKIKQIALNRITSSVNIRYEDDHIIKTTDIGLKIRNSGQKKHIPKEVRYSETPNPRNPERPYATWEYSEKAMNEIVEYLQTFPLIEEYLVWESEQEKERGNKKFGKDNARNNYLDDLMPFVEKIEDRMEELNKIRKFVENSKFRNHKFVPAGYQFMDENIIKSIDEKLTNLKSEERKGEEAVPGIVEKVPSQLLFAEMHPHWASPFKSDIFNFDFGDRVMNVNTSKRAYIKFCEIGTVIGFTLTQVVVMFDEPNLSLKKVYDQCQLFRGAEIDPESLINLTKKHDENKKSNRSNMRKGSKKY